jgi:hypothetical protein
MDIERRGNHPNTHVKAEREEKNKYYTTKVTIVWLSVVTWSLL